MHLLSRTAAYAATAVTALALVAAAATTSLASTPAHDAHTTAASAIKPAAAANPTSGYWTGTWATAPESGGDTFSGQTIRQGSFTRASAAPRLVCNCPTPSAPHR